MNIYKFFKTLHHYTIKHNDIETCIWKFYNKDSLLVKLYCKKGFVNTNGIKYDINQWYIKYPFFKSIANINQFYKENKEYLLKINSFVKNNNIIVKKLNKILKNCKKIVYDNIYEWKYENIFYLKLDLYKSPFLKSIYIKTDNNKDKCDKVNDDDKNFKNLYNEYVDYKTLFKILREINICSLLSTSNTNCNLLSCDLEKLTINNKRTYKIKAPFDINVVDYDQIRKKSPELFMKHSKERKLEIHCCKNYWEINFEQRVV